MTIIGRVGQKLSPKRFTPSEVWRFCVCHFCPQLNIFVTYFDFQRTRIFEFNMTLDIYASWLQKSSLEIIVRPKKLQTFLADKDMMARVCGHMEFMQSSKLQNCNALQVNKFNFENVFLVYCAAPQSVSLRFTRWSTWKKAMQNFHSIPSPWSQVQILLILQMFKGKYSKWIADFWDCRIVEIFGIW